MVVTADVTACWAIVTAMKIKNKRTTHKTLTMVTANVGLGAVHPPGCVPEAEGMSPARRARLTGHEAKTPLGNECSESDDEALR